MSSGARIHGSRNQREKVKALPLLYLVNFFTFPATQRNFGSCQRDFELSGFRHLSAQGKHSHRSDEF